MLALHEVTADGRLVQRGVIFDVDDEDAAFAELDERAVVIAGGAAGPLRRLVANLAGVGEPALHPDATFIDHTPASWGVLNTPGYLDLVKATEELAENFTVRLVEVPRLSDSGLLFRLRVTGEAVGNVFELEWWRASKFRDGLVVHVEQFPLEQRVPRRKRASRDSLPHQSPTRASPRTRRRGTPSDLMQRSRLAIQRGPRGCSRRAACVDDRRRLVGMRMSGESAFESARLLAGTEGLILTGEASRDSR